MADSRTNSRSIPLVRGSDVDGFAVVRFVSMEAFVEGFAVVVLAAWLSWHCAAVAVACRSSVSLLAHPISPRRQPVRLDALLTRLGNPVIAECVGYALADALIPWRVDGDGFLHPFARQG